MKRRSAVRRAAVWLRFLLWWGSETVVQAFTFRKPWVRNQRLPAAEKLFPASAWFFEREKSYCMVYPRNGLKIRIFRLHGIERN